MRKIKSDVLIQVEFICPNECGASIKCEVKAIRYPAVFFALDALLKNYNREEFTKYITCNKCGSNLVEKK